MTDTPRCDDLRHNPLDSNDLSAWVALAEKMERALSDATSDLDNARENWNGFIDPINTFCTGEPDFVIRHEGGPREAAQNVIDFIKARGDYAEKLAALVDRALTMMMAAGYKVSPHDPDHNNALVAWMADARAALRTENKAVPTRAKPPCPGCESLCLECPQHDEAAQSVPAIGTFEQKPLAVRLRMTANIYTDPRDGSLYREAADRIEELERQNCPSLFSGRWIPVGERMPPQVGPTVWSFPDDRQILARNSGGYMACVTALYRAMGGVICGEDATPEETEDRIGDVTHWMELPADPDRNCDSQVPVRCDGRDINKCPNPTQCEIEGKCLAEVNVKGNTNG